MARSLSSSIQDIYALSPMQQGMLFHALYEPESSVYLGQFIYKLRGRLDIRCFEEAWNHVVAEHPALRTIFRVSHKQPIQIVLKRRLVTLEVFDLRGQTAEAQEAEIETFLAEDRGHPFDVASDTPMRLTLFPVRDDEAVFIWSHHHILLDGWSIPLVLADLLKAYQALVTGNTPPRLARPPYRKYIEWLGRQDRQAALAFWSSYLAGLEAPTQLPFGRSPASTPLPRRAQELLTLPRTSTAALQTLARETRVTLNTLFQAAWGLLLGYYSGQEDVLFGSIFSGRPTTLPGAEDMIGVFINTLPVRLRITAKMQLAELLKQLQEQALVMQEFQHTPLTEIHECSALSATTPLFNSLMAFYNYPFDSRLAQADQALSVADVSGREMTHYPLTLIVMPGIELRLRFAYAPDRFDRETMHRISGHFQTLLEGMPIHLQTRVSELPILMPAEKHQLLVEFNNTATEFKELCTQQLFEAQVIRTPENQAVVAANRSMTYAELNVRANQIAHFLCARGVRPRMTVAILLGRSPDLVAAQLGIFKAGAAYVPIDPEYPEERMNYIIRNSQARFLLTERNLGHSLGVEQILYVEDVAASVDGAKNLPCANEADDLAYIIYTSGSTGQPKGVMIEHRSVVNLIYWVNRALQVGECDRVLCVTSVCFDLSVYDVFGPLAVGGCVHIASEEDRKDPSRLLDLLQTYPVTIWDSVPTTMGQLVRTAEDLKSSFRNESIRWVMLSGDWIPVPLPDRIKDYFVKAKVLSLGGATEGTVWSIYYPVESVSPTQSSIPYGKPIDNTQFYILDQYLRPCSIGTRGDLYIGGVGVARGYMNAPERTAQSFVPDQFTNVPGARMYRTGDLGRYMPDGNIEFLGRGDQQVKIHGFRVELGEIESVLTKHCSIKECVVIARQLTSQEKVLVAYIVSEGEPTAAELRTHLRTYLPDYMVPARFVQLSSLPLNVNGKVDRQGLPEPDHLRPTLSAAYTAPRTHREETLALIWQEALNLKQVGIHDNFFELGGDSILSIQVVSRANQSGLALTIKQLFEHPTIAELAQLVGTAGVVYAESSQMLGTVPLTPVQHWFFEQNLAEPHHWNQGVILQLRQPLDAALLKAGVEHLSRQHDALRLRFKRHGSSWEQRLVDTEQAITFSSVNLPASAAEPALAIEELAKEQQASINLSKGPLAKVVLCDVGTGQPGRLLIIIHHLVTDGVSWRILMEDLETALMQLVAHHEVRLPRKTASFSVWAQRLVEHAQSSAVCQEAAIWLAPTHTAGARLPVDYTAEPNTEGSADRVLVALSADETQLLLKVLPSVYRTQINEILLTALAWAIACWTGTSSVVVDLEGHGREPLFDDIDLSRTVGWFTSIQPLYLELNTAGTLVAALGSVKEQIRRIPNHGISYGLLRYLNREAPGINPLGTLPQPELSLNYMGQLDRTLYGSRLFDSAHESLGPLHGPRNIRPHLIEVEASILADRFQCSWVYSKNRHRRATIQHLAQRFIEALRSLVTQRPGAESVVYTPSDFPEAGLSQEALDRLLKRIG